MNYIIVDENNIVIAEFLYESDRDLCIANFREHYSDCTFTSRDN
jgi:hypothetical protein